MPTAHSDPSLVTAGCFRTMLEALSLPGSIHALPKGASPPDSMSEGMAALCLALADMDTPLWLDPSADGECLEWLRFNCGCPLVENPAQASLACVLDPACMPPLAAFHQGDAEYPDRSTTVFIAVGNLANARANGPANRGVRLSGPGIRRERAFEAEGLPDAFWKQWQENAAGYPLGVDVFFVSGRGIAALPRSVRAEVL